MNNYSTNISTDTQFHETIQNEYKILDLSNIKITNDKITNDKIINDKNSNINNIQDRIVKITFYFAYIFLITTGTITFIESLRTNNPTIRHIMNLETCISIVAGYFYSVFIDIIKETESKGQLLPYDTINNMRYTDWFISTPLMLLVLCIVLGMENNIRVKFKIYSLILIFNFAMLVSGYLGDIGVISKIAGLFIGFLWFFAMFGLIWRTFMSDKKSKESIVIYSIFIILWSLYGVAYMSETITKIISYNILDLIAKSFVGIFFWLYFTKVVQF